MFTALFIMTFLTGFFLGALALVGVLAILVKHDEKKSQNPYLNKETMERYRREMSGFNE